MIHLQYLNKYAKKIDLAKSKQSHTKKNKYRNKFKHSAIMIGGFANIDVQYIEQMDKFIKSYNKTAGESNQIDESHGLTHTLTVLCHTDQAIKANNLSAIKKVPNTKRIGKSKANLVKLAALLHDIDDSKYFPDNTEFQNAKSILKSVGLLSTKEIKKIIYMISLVSSSKNGDSIPENCTGKKYYKLYPRYADRLEALGIIGVQRTLNYTLHKKQELYLPTEPKPDVTIDYIYKYIATEERYKQYSGKSKSMMDHFYDKLLRLGKYPISNDYFTSECKLRQKPLEDIAVKFEQNGSISEKTVRQYIQDAPVVSCSCNDLVFAFTKKF